MARSIKQIVSGGMAVAASILGGCAGRGISHTDDSWEAISQRLARGEAILLDVRETAEWREGVVEGAILVSFQQFRQDPDAVLQQIGLPKDKIVYTYCKAGGRASIAGQLLQQRGYDARPLKPGFTELVQMGAIAARPNLD